MGKSESERVESIEVARTLRRVLKWGRQNFDSNWGGGNPNLRNCYQPRQGSNLTMYEGFQGECGLNRLNSKWK